MTRDELIEERRGEYADAIDRMANDAHDRVLHALQSRELPVHKRWYFFLTRVGTDFDKYPFPWEPLRDFAGPLLPGRDAMPIVLVSRDDVQQPATTLVTDPCPHHAIEIARTMSTRQIVNAWLECLADDDAIPLAGGDRAYQWFFETLQLTPPELSQKARLFINRYEGR